MTAHDLHELRQALAGDLIDENDPRYAERRALYNGMVDKHPLAIARVRTVADVVAALRWAVREGVVIAVRGAGHNGAGLGSVDGGLVVDLGEMRDVSVDPVSRTVRADGGATLADIDAVASAHGLAVPTGFVSSTGIGGLTLGGGSGYLTRAHGLTIDNLLEAEVVLADGAVVTASESSHPDLFWALRGGGGNFGVVTSFTFRAHPVGDVFGGPVFWDLEDAGAMLRAYRDHLPETPENLAVFAGLKTVPQGDPFPPEHQGKTVGALIACFVGSEEEGRAAMEPMMRDLPEPLFDWRSQVPFAQLQQLFDPLMPPGMQWYWRGDFVTDLPDDAIAVHLEHAGRLGPGDQSVMHMYPIDGAVHRVAPESTAWRRRDVTWSLVVAGISSDPGRAEEVTRWAREYYDGIHRFSSVGGYLNFQMPEDLEADGERVRASFGANYPRLVQVKTAYDPANVFSINPNIRPDPVTAAAR